MASLQSHAADRIAPSSELQRLMTVALFPEEAGREYAKPFHRKLCHEGYHEICDEPIALRRAHQPFPLEFQPLML